MSTFCVDMFWPGLVMGALCAYVGYLVWRTFLSAVDLFHATKDGAE